MNTKFTKTYIVAISGASGMLFSIRLLKALLEKPFRIFLIVSDSARLVIEHELAFKGDNWSDLFKEHQFLLHSDSQFFICNNNDYFKPPASGSFRHDGMIVVPCSMKTLAAISNGFSTNLIVRSADVTLKERRPLILIPRETPFNLIHLRNMQNVLLAGATVMPPIFPFYHAKMNLLELIDAQIGRVFDHLDIHHNFYPEWGIP